MTRRPSLDRMRRDLYALKEHEVVAYGSVLTDRFTDRSDVDVAVLTRQTDAENNRKYWTTAVGQAPDRYDVRVFELLPLNLQIDVADRHEVVFGDPVAISYYFYRFRRRWKDQQHRYRENQFTGYRQKRDALRRSTNP